MQGETTSWLKMRDAQCPLVFDTAAQTTRSMKFPEENSIEEISRKIIVDFQRSTGAVTFSTCYLASCRGIIVALKELRSRWEARADTEKQRNQIMSDRFRVDNLLETSVISMMGGVPIHSISTAELKYIYYLWNNLMNHDLPRTKTCWGTEHAMYYKRVEPV